MATPPRARVFPAVPLVVGGGRILPSPSQFYLTGEDSLQVAVCNSVANAAVVVRARIARENGDTIAEQWIHQPASDRSTSVEVWELGTGTLLNVSAYATNAAVSIGQLYVVLYLVRGSGPARIALSTLVGGYITSSQGLAFPGSPITNSIDGRGSTRLIVGTTPAAGAELLETVPTGARWEFLTLSTAFTEAAGLAAIPKLVFDNGAGNEIGSVDATVAVSTNTITYSWLAGLGFAPVAQNGLRVGLSFPSGFTLPAGYRIRTVTSNMNAADSYTAPVYTVREWLEVG